MRGVRGGVRVRRIYVSVLQMKVSRGKSFRMRVAGNKKGS